MNKIVDLFNACLPFLLGLVGVFFSLFFSLPESDRGTEMLSSFVTTGALFTTFTAVSLSFFLSQGGDWAKKVKKNRIFLPLVNAVKSALFCFLLLLLISMLGFFFYTEKYYAPILFFFFGLSAGLYWNVIRLMILAGTLDTLDAQKKRQETPDKLSPQSYHADVDDVIDPDGGSNQDKPKLKNNVYDEEINKIIEG